MRFIDFLQNLQFSSDLLTTVYVTDLDNSDVAGGIESSLGDWFLSTRRKFILPRLFSEIKVKTEIDGIIYITIGGNR